jgi:predicted SAM-dependent methyltransferase
MDERERLDAYFATVDEAQGRLNSTNPTDSRLRRITKHAVPVKRRGTARMIVTNTVMPVQRRKARRIAESCDSLKLHLGSGSQPKDGWVNVDLAGDPIDLAWNLAHGIPFCDFSIDAIFHEHFLEHISLQAAIGVMDESFRVLKPGGILRIGVPDAGELLKSYAGDGERIETIHPGRPTRMLAVQELFYWHRHTTMYDEETLALMFKAGGFPSPTERRFGDTDLETAPDTERRRAETLYMEAVKPAVE